MPKPLMHVPLPSAGVSFCLLGSSEPAKRIGLVLIIDEVLDLASRVKQIESNIGWFALKGNER